MNPSKRHNSVVIAIAQAKREPWAKIYHEEQLPTWISRFQNKVQNSKFLWIKYESILANV